ncbi:hypothetical protein LCGC14_2656560, partial [marine sediment metagenome]
TAARVGFGYISGAQAQKVLADTQQKARYQAASNEALVDPEGVLRKFKTKDGKQFIEGHEGLTAGEQQAIRSIAEGKINFNKRQEDAALSSFFEDVTRKAEEGMLPAEMRNILRETQGLTTKEKQKAMNTFMSAYNTWTEGGTKENPWKTTQNWPALMEVQLAIDAGEPLTSTDVWRAMLAGGKVNFSRADALNLINQLPDNKDDSLKSGLANEWSDIIRSHYSTEEVADGKFAIPKEKIGEWAAMQRQANAIIIKHKDDPVYKDVNKRAKQQIHREP